MNNVVVGEDIILPRSLWSQLHIRLLSKQKISISPVGEGLALPENIGFRYASVRGYTSVYEARTVAAEERGTRLSLPL